ncbi:hypothetical protein GALMADRAFT_61725 [Galerina marginata CBS 339.88]|uniref:non-specific serine/threonine protein kinase n=1 Tax=Galerina marginata (strain CBS 339.88) TaxID=685588 RepID=A0A067TMM1_GALM3|nr:hypothetical protein GALMADRAFT_61725 [Galerina marginata CBS 339.88]
MRNNPYVQDAGLERYLNYRPGGFHPVHLGDKFQDKRYTVVNKLGYGSFSTVWLVRDEIQNLYASLKILSADASEYSTGTEHDVLRRSTTGSGSGKRFVLQFLDSFIHKGPNGKHLCVVTEVSGPSLAMWLDAISDFGELPLESARALIPQLAQGVEYLHSCDIVHGDLHLGNILYHSSLLESQENIEKYFGTPQKTLLRIRHGATPPYSAPHVPRYVVHTPDQSCLLEAIFETPSLVQLKICDFSEASLHDPTRPKGVKRKLNCPSVHAAPEVIFDELVSPASDMWAMGNTMHQILTGGREGATVIRGAPGCSRDEVVCQMVRLLGRPPDRWWTRWEARSKYFDEAENWIGNTEANRTPKPLGIRFRADYLPLDEQQALQKVLAGIFVYEPQDRLTARDVVSELACFKLEEK